MQKLRLRPIIDSSALTVLAVEAIESHHTGTRNGCRLFASVRPTAVVVCSRAEAYALDMEAKPVDLDLLRQEFSELDAKIQGFLRT